MDIAKLAQKPQLQKLILDDADIVERFGEPITFWIYDHMGISTYFNFYKLQQSEDDTLLNDLLRKIILKEDGTLAIGADEVLPVQLVLAILMRINDFLGKSSPTAPSTQKTGKQQS
jgi:hypothetical protein